MRGKLCLVAVSILALTLAGLGGALGYADDQPLASKSHSGTDFLQSRRGPSAYRLPTTLPSTQYVFQ